MAGGARFNMIRIGKPERKSLDGVLRRQGSIEKVLEKERED